MFTSFAKVQVLLLQLDIFSLVVCRDVSGTAGFAADIILGFRLCSSFSDTPLWYALVFPPFRMSTGSCI